VKQHNKWLKKLFTDIVGERGELVGADVELFELIPVGKSAGQSAELVRLDKEYQKLLPLGELIRKSSELIA